MWTILCPNQWVWILPVGLDFVSGSGFCLWVWIASGSGYEHPMDQTPCCIMWSTHNHGIIKLPPYVVPHIIKDVFNTDEKNEYERVIEMIKELSVSVNGFNESEIADILSFISTVLF